MTATAEAGAELADLHREHYRALIGQARVTVHDRAAAEDVVQDSFAALLTAWPRLRDPAAAPAYLRASVANRARDTLRRRATEDRHAPGPPLDVPAAESAALAALDRAAVLAALRRLPERQRRVIVLRYFGGLPERQIAEAMGIRPGTVKAHASRALAALRLDLGTEGGR